MAYDGLRPARALLLETGAGDALRETPLAAHLPYVTALGEAALVLREGDLMATLRIGGRSSMTCPDAELDALRRAVAAVVAQSGGLFGFYVHRISAPQEVAMPPVPGPGFAAGIDARWQAHLGRLAPKSRRLYLTILRRPDLEARLPLLGRIAQKAWVRDRAARLEELNEVAGFFEAALAAAAPRRLTLADGEWLGVLNALLGGGYRPLGPGAAALPLAHVLATHRASFEENTIRLDCAATGETRYGALFSAKSYPGVTEATMLDAIDLPLDTVVTNSFTPIPANVMAERIQRIIRQMRASDDAAVSLREELALAADDQEAGRIVFGNHHLTVVVYAPSRALLDEAGAELKRAGQEIMASFVREKMALKACYFAQHPGNYAYRARKTPISSINFADFAALHAPVEGRAAAASPWGRIITTFPAAGTSAYRFNFHEAGAPEAEPTVGHTLLLGRTGTGKTLTAAFLAAQARRAGARLFFFDKDHGLEMAVRALGGRYHTLRAGVPAGLNPLATETDLRGQAWLADWLGALLGAGAPLSGAQARHLQRAVRQNAEAGPRLQSFAQFETLFRALDDGGELQLRLAEWAPGGRYGWVFAESDEAAAPDLGAEIAGFDMTELMDLKAERMALLSYVFRRIERTVEDRRPTLIVIDEAWKLLDDPYFAARLENWLVTLRKLNAVVMLLTQSPGQLARSAAGKTIAETLATQVLFPNDHARPEDFATLGLSGKEAELLTQPAAGQRIALVRSGGDSLFVDADLGALGPLMTILGGGRAGEALVGPGWRETPDFWRRPCA